MKLLLILAAALLLIGGSARAAYNDGLAALEAGDDAGAFAEFSALAENGHREAQFTLAFLYDFGQGVEQDSDQAIKWYRTAAEQGLAEAQLSLALIYADGRGMPQDYGQAAIWYRRAARQGNALAQNELAELYRRGKGVEPDLVEAFVWYDAAADNLPSGEARQSVIQSRDAVAADLSDEELAVALNRAESLQLQAELPPSPPAQAEVAAVPSEPPVEAAEPIETLAEPSTEIASPEPAEAAPAAQQETIPEPVTETEPASGPDPVEEAVVAARAAPTNELEPEEVGLAPPSEPVQPAAEIPPLSAGERSRVARVQALLQELGYAPGPVDGQPGGLTQAAVRAFEADHGWPLSGAITPKLEETLVRVRDGRRLAHFQEGGPLTAANPGPPAPASEADRAFGDILTSVLGDGGQSRTTGSTGQDQTAAHPNVEPPEVETDHRSGVVDVIDERTASLGSIMDQVTTVSAAGLGWTLLTEWQGEAERRFGQVTSQAAARELRQELKRRREASIVLGDPYGNFLRVTDSYLLYLEQLKARFR